MDCEVHSLGGAKTNGKALKLVWSFGELDTLQQLKRRLPNISAAAELLLLRELKEKVSVVV